MLRHPLKTDLAALLLCGVLTGCGGGGGGAAPSQPNPAPVLTAISPLTVSPGSGAFTLTATGTNFSASSMVEWNGSPRTATFVSATRLTAQIMASDVASGGKANITVVTPSPGGGDSTALTLTITAVNATVQQIAPGGHAASSAHYQIVGTLGGGPDSSAAQSTHYIMQGGLAGAGISVP
jgi:hypothetical protein